jgi:hypothetical protein
MFLNPFTGDFDLPKRICLNGLFWFSFDKVRHFISKFSTLVTSQKKVLFALSDASKSDFDKCSSTSFLNNSNNHLFFEILKKSSFLNELELKM